MTQLQCNIPCACERNVTTVVPSHASFHLPLLTLTNYCEGINNCTICQCTCLPQFLV